MYPLKFKPILKQTIWGGDRIIPFKHLNENLPNVGESWEISGVPGNESVVANGEFRGKTLRELINIFREELVGESVYKRFSTTFPLLIKFIDARQDLSIQVHPDDETAKKRHNSLGKTEMWYVMDATEGAKLRSGFKTKIGPKEYKELVHNSTITDVLAEYEIKKGDVFFLQLHTELAKDVIDYEVHDDYRTQYTPEMNEPVELVACPYFTTSVYDMTETINCDYTELDSFIIYICMEGSCTITNNEGDSIELQAGESTLLAATTQEVTIEPHDHVKLLETYV